MVSNIITACVSQPFTYFVDKLNECQQLGKFSFKMLIYSSSEMGANQLTYTFRLRSGGILNFASDLIL